MEILYVPDCPHRTLATERVREALAHSGAHADIRETIVREHSEAVSRGFAGSPTILVNGRDVEPGHPKTENSGLTCRLYAAGNIGAPDLDVIIRAIREAQKKEG